MPPFVDGMGPDEMEAAASDAGSYSEDDDDPDSTWRSSVVYLFTWWVPPIKRLFVRPRKRVDFEAAVVAANEPSAAPAIASPQVAISINPQFNPPVAEPLTPPSKSEDAAPAEPPTAAVAPAPLLPAGAPSAIEEGDEGEEDDDEEEMTTPAHSPPPRRG